MKEFIIASIPRRMLAHLVDFAIVSLVTLPVAFLFHGNSLACFLLYMGFACIYYVRSSSGQSIGQRTMNIHVVLSDGQPMSRKVAFNRTLSQFLCPSVAMMLLQMVSVVRDNTYVLIIGFLLHTGVIVFWTHWYILALFSRNKQTLHDLLYNTIVITTNRV